MKTDVCKLFLLLFLFFSCIFKADAYLFSIARNVLTGFYQHILEIFYAIDANLWIPTYHYPMVEYRMHQTFVKNEQKFENLEPGNDSYENEAPPAILSQPFWYHYQCPGWEIDVINTTCINYEAVAKQLKSTHTPLQGQFEPFWITTYWLLLESLWFDGLFVFFSQLPIKAAEYKDIISTKFMVWLEQEQHDDYLRQIFGNYDDINYISTIIDEIIHTGELHLWHLGFETVAVLLMCTGLGIFVHCIIPFCLSIILWPVQKLWQKLGQLIFGVNKGHQEEETYEENQYERDIQLEEWDEEDFNELKLYWQEDLEKSEVELEESGEELEERPHMKEAELAESKEELENNRYIDEEAELEESGEELKESPHNEESELEEIGNELKEEHPQIEEEFEVEEELQKEESVDQLDEEEELHDEGEDKLKKELVKKEEDKENEKEENIDGAVTTKETDNKYETNNKTGKFFVNQEFQQLAKNRRTKSVCRFQRRQYEEWRQDTTFNDKEDLTDMNFVEEKLTIWLQKVGKNEMSLPKWLRAKRAAKVRARPDRQDEHDSMGYGDGRAEQINTENTEQINTENTEHDAQINSDTAQTGGQAEDGENNSGESNKTSSDEDEDGESYHTPRSDISSGISNDKSNNILNEKRKSRFRRCTSCGRTELPPLARTRKDSQGNYLNIYASYSREELLEVLKKNITVYNNTQKTTAAHCFNIQRRQKERYFDNRGFSAINVINLHPSSFVRFKKGKQAKVPHKANKKSEMLSGEKENTTIRKSILKKFIYSDPMIQTSEKKIAINLFKSRSADKVKFIDQERETPSFESSSASQLSAEEKPDASSSENTLPAQQWTSESLTTIKTHDMKEFPEFEEFGLVIKPKYTSVTAANMELYKGIDLSSTISSSDSVSSIESYDPDVTIDCKAKVSKWLDNGNDEMIDDMVCRIYSLKNKSETKFFGYDPYSVHASWSETTLATTFNTNEDLRCDDSSDIVNYSCNNNGSEDGICAQNGKANKRLTSEARPAPRLCRSKPTFIPQPTGGTSRRSVYDRKAACSEKATSSAGTAATPKWPKMAKSDTTAPAWQPSRRIPVKATVETMNLLPPQPAGDRCQPSHTKAVNEVRTAGARMSPKHYRNYSTNQRACTGTKANKPARDNDTRLPYKHLQDKPCHSLASTSNCREHDSKLSAPSQTSSLPPPYPKVQNRVKRAYLGLHSIEDNSVVLMQPDKKPNDLSTLSPLPQKSRKDVKPCTRTDKSAAHSQRKTSSVKHEEQPSNYSYGYQNERMQLPLPNQETEMKAVSSLIQHSEMKPMTTENEKRKAEYIVKECVAQTNDMKKCISSQQKQSFNKWAGLPPRHPNPTASELRQRAMALSCNGNGIQNQGCNHEGSHQASLQNSNKKGARYANKSEIRKLTQNINLAGKFYSGELTRQVDINPELVQEIAMRPAIFPQIMMMDCTFDLQSHMINRAVIGEHRVYLDDRKKIKITQIILLVSTTVKNRLNLLPMEKYIRQQNFILEIDPPHITHLSPPVSPISDGNSSENGSVTYEQYLESLRSFGFLYERRNGKRDDDLLTESLLEGKSSGSSSMYGEESDYTDSMKSIASDCSNLQSLASQKEDSSDHDTYGSIAEEVPKQTSENEMAREEMAVATMKAELKEKNVTSCEHVELNNNKKSCSMEYFSDDSSQEYDDSVVHMSSKYPANWARGNSSSSNGHMAEIYRTLSELSFEKLEAEIQKNNSAGGEDSKYLVKFPPYISDENNVTGKKVTSPRRESRKRQKSPIKDGSNNQSAFQHPQTSKSTNRSDTKNSTGPLSTSIPSCMKKRNQSCDIDNLSCDAATTVEEEDPCSFPGRKTVTFLLESQKRKHGEEGNKQDNYYEMTIDHSSKLKEKVLPREIECQGGHKETDVQHFKSCHPAFDKMYSGSYQVKEDYGKQVRQTLEGRVGLSPESPQVPETSFDGNEYYKHPKECGISMVENCSPRGLFPKESFKSNLSSVRQYDQHPRCEQETSPNEFEKETKNLEMDLVMHTTSTKEEYQSKNELDDAEGMDGAHPLVTMKHQERAQTVPRAVHNSSSQSSSEDESDTGRQEHVSPKDQPDIVKSKALEPTEDTFPEAEASVIEHSGTHGEENPTFGHTFSAVMNTKKQHQSSYCKLKGRKPCNNDTDREPGFIPVKTCKSSETLLPELAKRKSNMAYRRLSYPLYRQSADYSVLKVSGSFKAIQDMLKTSDLQTEGNTSENARSGWKPMGEDSDTSLYTGASTSSGRQYSNRAANGKMSADLYQIRGSGRKSIQHYKDGTLTRKWNVKDYPDNAAELARSAPLHVGNLVPYRKRNSETKVDADEPKPSIMSKSRSLAGWAIQLFKVPLEALFGVSKEQQLEPCPVGQPRDKMPDLGSLKSRFNTKMAPDARINTTEIHCIMPAASDSEED